jgi:hypothetical protein
VAAVSDAACRALAATRTLPEGVVPTSEWPDADFWGALAPHGMHVVCLAARADDQPFADPAR